MTELTTNQIPITIGALERIIEHYPTDATTVCEQPSFRSLRSELEERTTFFIAQQLHRIRTALFVIGGLLLLSTISIARVVVGVRFSDQCPVKPEIAMYLIVQGAHVFFLIIAPIILITFYLSVAAARRASLFAAIRNRFYLISMIVIVVVVAFRLIWALIMPYVWVINDNELQLTNSTSSTYCHPTLYRFFRASVIIAVLGGHGLVLLLILMDRTTSKQPPSARYEQFQKICVSIFPIVLIIAIYL